MPITNEVEKWLLENGYTNYCFISYAHTGETHMTEFARRIQKAIEEELRTQVSNPRVFLDSTHIPPGNIWPEELKANLSSSVAMVAILSQVYFSDNHSWCGKEWGAMASLGSARFPKTTVQPIIPVLFRETILPTAAILRQPIDLSRNQILGRRFFAVNEFRIAIQKIVNQIETIANLIHKNHRGANIDSVVWPQESPFVGYTPPKQPPPLRTASFFKEHPADAVGNS